MSTMHSLLITGVKGEKQRWKLKGKLVGNLKESRGVVRSRYGQSTSYAHMKMSQWNTNVQLLCVNKNVKREKYDDG